MTPKIITESATEPILIDEAAANLRVTLDSNSPPAYPEAARITKLIKAARQACEEELEVSLVAKTLEIAQDSFYVQPTNPHLLARQYYNNPAFSQFRPAHAYAIKLPLGPVRSIVSVTYIDTDGADVVLASDQYKHSSYARTEMIVPAYGVSWPTGRTDLDSVRVRYTVGYPSDDSPPQEVPEPIRQAMHLFIAHYFSNREAVDLDTLADLPLGVRYLLGKFRQGLGV